MWLPKIVQNELISIATDVERIRERFSETLVSGEELNSILNEESLLEIANEVISEFSNWKPLDLHIEDEADDVTFVQD